MSRSVVAQKTAEETDQCSFVVTDDGRTPTSKLVQGLRHLGIKVSVYSENSLDENFPPPQKPTKRCVVMVPTESNSADKAGMTLRECLLVCTMHLLKTGQPLDPRIWTICSGSPCCLDGSVPWVTWYPERNALRIFWHRIDCQSTKALVPSVSV